MDNAQDVCFPWLPGEQARLPGVETIQIDEPYAPRWVIATLTALALGHSRSGPAPRCWVRALWKDWSACSLLNTLALERRGAQLLSDVSFLAPGSKTPRRSRLAVMQWWSHTWRAHAQIVQQDLDAHQIGAARALEELTQSWHVWSGARFDERKAEERRERECQEALMADFERHKNWPLKAFLVWIGVREPSPAFDAGRAPAMDAPFDWKSQADLAIACYALLTQRRRLVRDVWPKASAALAAGKVVAVGRRRAGEDLQPVSSDQWENGLLSLEIQDEVTVAVDLAGFVIWRDVVFDRASIVATFERLTPLPPAPAVSVSKEIAEAASSAREEGFVLQRQPLPRDAIEENNPLAMVRKVLADTPRIDGVVPEARDVFGCNEATAAQVVTLALEFAPDGIEAWTAAKPTRLRGDLADEISKAFPSRYKRELAIKTVANVLAKFKGRWASRSTYPTTRRAAGVL